MLQYDIHSVPCFVLLEPGGVLQRAIRLALVQLHQILCGHVRQLTNILCSTAHMPPRMKVLLVGEQPSGLLLEHARCAVPPAAAGLAVAKSVKPRSQGHVTAALDELLSLVPARAQHKSVKAARQ